MARTLENLAIGPPVDHLAAGMGADRRVAHHAIGGARAGRRFEYSGIQPHHQHFVQPRPAAYDIPDGIHRPRQDLTGAEREAFRCQRDQLGAADLDQQVTFLRAFIRRIGLRSCRPRCEADPGGKQCPAPGVAAGDARRAGGCARAGPCLAVQHLLPRRLFAERYQSSSRLSRQPPVVFYDVPG